MKKYKSTISAFNDGFVQGYEQAVKDVTLNLAFVKSLKSMIRYYRK